MNRTRNMTTLQLCMLAMAVCINVAGGQLALMLRLPIYLDSIGTILTGLWRSEEHTSELQSH